jgi:hypothetical protein
MVPSQALYFLLIITMSVCVLTASEYGSIAATLRTGRTSLREPLFPLSVAERFEYQVFKEYHKQSEDEYRLALVDPFVFRLFIANQIAEEYTYMKPGHKNLVVPIIEFPASPRLSLRALLEKLDAVSYNVITNGGNSFLGQKDAEKLDQIISIVQRELIFSPQA